MRISIVNQFYPPDLSPTAKLAASLAEHRALQGDEVTVIAGMGYVDDQNAGVTKEHSNFAQHTAGSPRPIPRAVRVRRIWTPQLGKKTLWRRACDYATFFALTIWTLLRLPRQDLIICLTTPPFIPLAGAMHKLLHPRTRLMLWNMDCYPEVAERAGVIRTGGVTSRLMQWLNRRLNSVVDHIVCLDGAMRSLVLARESAVKSKDNETASVRTRSVEGRSDESGPSDLSISVIPNWEPLRSEEEEGWHNRAASSSEEFIVLYSGNMGHGHCFESTIAAAQRLHQEKAPVRFIFTGGGVQSQIVRREVEEKRLSNIDFLGYVSASELSKLQRSAGCALITLKQEMLGVMSPSKLHGSLAMGLPILYVGPAGSNVDEAVVRFQCGVSLRPCDVHGFVDFIHTLRGSPAAHDTYRARARSAFEEAYCDRRCLPQFDRKINSVVGLASDETARRAA